MKGPRGSVRIRHISTAIDSSVFRVSSLCGSVTVRIVS